MRCNSPACHCMIVTHLSGWRRQKMLSSRQQRHFPHSHAVMAAHLDWKGNTGQQVTRRPTYSDLHTQLNTRLAIQDERLSYLAMALLSTAVIKTLTANAMKAFNLHRDVLVISGYSEIASFAWSSPILHLSSDSISEAKLGHTWLQRTR